MRQQRFYKNRLLKNSPILTPKEWSRELKISLHSVYWRIRKGDLYGADSIPEKRKMIEEPVRICKDCGTQVSKFAMRCRDCNLSSRRRHPLDKTIDGERINPGHSYQWYIDNEKKRKEPAIFKRIGF